MDVTDPAAAFEVGPVLHSVARRAVDVTVSGPYAYLSLGGNGLAILDVSSCWAINPEHPGVPGTADLPPQGE